MKLWAIADLHLGHAVDKPMDVFGERWENHVERLEKGWRATVGEDDLVLLGGDNSWASSLDEVVPDLQWIDRLPGIKYMIRGNHDYWWTTLRKLTDVCEAHDLTTLHFLRNDAVALTGFHVCHARGWLLPTDDGFTVDDAKVYRRELIRLDLSIASLEALRKRDGIRPTIALTHYPPISEAGAPSLASEKLVDASVDVCCFGHIHHRAPYYQSRPSVDGIRYVMVSSDQLGFRPYLVGENGQFQEESNDA
ncbi:MAG: metallophosphoesterase [Saccharofermentanales bacterium]|jgi:predicted phosphohydrolase